VKRFLPASALATVAGLAFLALLAGCSGAAPAPVASGAGSGSASSAPARSSPAASALPAGSPAAASPTATAAPPGSATAVVAASLAALKAGRAVHVTISTVLPNGTITYTDDATADGGRQYITLSTGGSVTVLYVGGVGYVEGDAQGLVGFMQVPLSQAQSLAGEWIAVHPGEELGTNTYADIVAGITLSSVASEIALAAPLTLTPPATVAGQRAIGVRGGVPASDQLPASTRATLDVAAAGSRPLRETVVASDGYTSTTTFSDWGESVPLSPPQHPVAPAASPPALD
jgi:hypothetical protein